MKLTTKQKEFKRLYKYTITNIFNLLNIIITKSNVAKEPKNEIIKLLATRDVDFFQFKL